MKLLSYGRPQIIVQDYNGKYYLAGIENGCEVAANTATGAAMGDLNGYNITFTGTEKTPANFVAFAAMVTSADIVVVSGV